MKELIYLYCFARTELLPTVEGIGLNGKSSFLLVKLLDLCAVVSTISHEEFCGPSAELKLRDLNWLGPRVCRHEEVVEQVMHRSPVFPAQFGTIFSSQESLEKLMEMHHNVISHFLEKVADKEEWAVKGLLEKEKAEEELFSILLTQQKESLNNLSPGMRYFQEKQIKASIEKELKHRLKKFSRWIAKDLSTYSSDFIERKSLHHDVSREYKSMILNWAFLVARNMATDFRERVHIANSCHAPKGMCLEYSGPWPPYSFCPSLEMESIV
jgi:hypothetical protein